MISKGNHLQDWERVTASKLCGGGLSTVGGKDCTRSGIGGGKALCHHCPDDSLACPYVDGNLSGETLRQLKAF